jgi:hypothetical protein
MHYFYVKDNILITLKISPFLAQRSIFVKSIANYALMRETQQYVYSKIYAYTHKIEKVLSAQKALLNCKESAIR